MLNRIERIKGLGVFGDFTVPQTLPVFARYNIIYGPNGSGKTTLSRLFAILETGAHDEFDNLEYKLDTKSGPRSHGQALGRKVRVFNSDYVDANIGQLQEPLRHILIVGEENKALAADAAAERTAYDARVRAIEDAKSATGKLEDEKGKIYSAIAKTIGEATSGKSLRGYRKPDAEAAFAQETDLKTIDDATLTVHRATVQQEQLEAVPIPLWMDENGSSGNSRLATQCAELARQITDLLARTAQSDALRRLMDEPAIARWVEEGLTLHREHGSQYCEFCAQPLPEDRMKRLAKHFGVEDQQLKTEIESAIADVVNLSDQLAVVALPPKAALYSELRGDYEVAANVFEENRTVLTNQLSETEGVLREKLLQRATPLTREVSIDPQPTQIALGRLAEIIRRHNEKTAAFEQERNRARKEIERHYLSTISEQIKELNQQITIQQSTVARLTNGAPDLADPRSLAELKAGYEAKQAMVSSAHAGGVELSQQLRTFLGRTDLRFESSDDGYLVMRRGKPAKRLSEGEKTAIAFLYFIVQLRDQDFELPEGLVVIDDPVSSLDSSSIYQAFAFLKKAVRDAGQIFILTHNFDFLKLLLNWTQHFKKDTAYLMIVFAETEDSREANLQPLDDLLHNHPTEYCYLFKLLHSFQSDGSIRTSYHIPNVARKVLETFLEFQRPYEASLYKKLEAIEFDSHKKTAIYKFANDLSHFTGKGFDPALVAETQKNVSYLLEMIKATAPEHYDGLEQLACT